MDTQRRNQDYRTQTQTLSISSIHWHNQLSCSSEVVWSVSVSVYIHLVQCFPKCLNSDDTITRFQVTRNVHLFKGPEPHAGGSALAWLITMHDMPATKGWKCTNVSKELFLGSSEKSMKTSQTGLYIAPKHQLLRCCRTHALCVSKHAEGGG